MRIISQNTRKNATLKFLQVINSKIMKKLLGIIYGDKL